MPAPYLVVVDDNTDEELLITRFVNTLDTPPDVLWLSDGEQALEYLANPHKRLPDLVLLDHKMPKMSGLEVLGKLEKITRLSQVPIVMISTHFSKSEVRKALSLGARSVVLKPDSITQWNKRLKILLTYWLSVHESSAPDVDIYDSL